MKQNIIKDLSALTTIPEATLQKLAEKIKWCICDDIEESLLKGDSVTEIDVGIGTLFVGVKNESVSYYFTPSKNLESSVKETIVDGKNPLTDKIEQSLVSKVVNAYKNFI